MPRPQRTTELSPVEVPADVGALAPEALARGVPVQRMSAGPFQAVQVVRPRDVKAAEKEARAEARFLGEQFFYGWDIRGKNPKHVEGIGIVGAMAILRSWGNCAVDVQLAEESDEAWTFEATFLDAERGTALRRLYRQPKTKVEGQYEPERALNMTFQKGQSIAVRGAVLHGLPASLRGKCLREAKLAAQATIKEAELPQHRARVVAAFAKLGVSQERLERKVEKPLGEWGREEVVELEAMWRGIKAEGVSVGEAFPPEVRTAEVDLGAAAVVPGPTTNPDQRTLGLDREPGQEG